MNSQYYICSTTDYGDETVRADYSHHGVAQIRTHSGRERESCDRVEYCWIIGISDISTKIWSPIPHIHLKHMFVDEVCRIWYSESQGVHAEVWDACWCYGENFARAVDLDEIGW